MIAATPDPPYTAVIFTSVRSEVDEVGYGAAAARMEALARQQPGYLGIESVRAGSSGVGITVSYWATERDAVAWKRDAEHLVAQQLGSTEWYDRYVVRVATVSRTYGGGRRASGEQPASELGDRVVAQPGIAQVPRRGAVPPAETVEEGAHDVGR